MDPEAELIRQAEVVVELAGTLGVELLLIGAGALAGHGYVRLTQDLDLAGNLSLDHLRELAAVLRRSGCAVELREPDAEDPLGGVLDIHADFGQIQIISFEGRFPAVIRDALGEATLRVRRDSPLRIIPLPHLVALKLYAGGLKSKADIVEVLSRNPDADLDAIGLLCDRYRLPGFTEIRRELGR